MLTITDHDGNSAVLSEEAEKDLAFAARGEKAVDYAARTLTDTLGKFRIPREKAEEAEPLTLYKTLPPEKQAEILSTLKAEAAKVAEANPVSP